MARLTGLEEQELKQKLQNDEGDGFRENAVDLFENLVIEHSQQRAKTKADQFHQKGYKEGAQKAEQEKVKLLSETFGLEVQTVEELADQLGKKLSDLEAKANAPKKADQLTPDEIRKLDVFKSTLRELVEQEAGQYMTEAQKAQQRAEQAEQALQQFHQRNAVRSALEPVLNEAKANFGPSSSKTWDYFFHTVPTKVEDGKVLFLNSEGEPITDKYGDPVTPKEFLIEQGQWPLGFAQAAKPGTPGAGSPDGNKGSGGPVKTFKDEADYHRQLAAAGSDRKKIQELSKLYIDQMRSGGFK